MADEQWHVGIRGEQKGPFPEEEIKAMIARGEVGPSDYVWQEGMESWAAVRDVEAFAEALKEVPPPPRRPVPGAECISGFCRDLGAVLRDPDEGLNAVADRKPVCFATTWIVLGVIVFALLTMQGRVAYALRIFQPRGPDGIVFLKSLFLGVVLYGIWYGIVMVALGPILKSRAEWKDGLAILGISTIPTASIGLVLFALLWIQSADLQAFLVVILATVMVPWQVLLFYRTFLHTSGVNRRAALCAIPLIYLAASFLYGLLIIAR